MPAELSSIRIEGLHGGRTFDVPIVDNKLILVGDNGTGKSTVLHFLYAILSKQWQRLVPYHFRVIEILLHGVRGRIERSDIDQLYCTPRNLRHSAAQLARLYLPRNASQASRLWPEDIVTLSDLELSELEHLLESSLGAKERPLNIQSVEDLLARSGIGEVLYLPTYRRVEQDLEAIFPGQGSEVRRLSRRAERQSDESVSLVRFGMEDVRETIQRVMNQLKDSARSSLTDLTSAYLRDLLSGDVRRFDPMAIQRLDEAALDVILSRIDVHILPDLQRQTLKDIVEHMKISGEVEEKNLIALGFLERLAALYEEQQTREQGVRMFVGLCNQYLFQKQLVYDTTNFTVTVRGSGGNISVAHADSTEGIPLRALSSGEKQIISLFATLLLSDIATFFLIIDEPELSLSVPWQQRLLPDVLATARVNGLVAATHSPFIFDNELDASTHALTEFTEVTDVAGT